jgi:hypothetical protein
MLIHYHTALYVYDTATPPPAGVFAYTLLPYVHLMDISSIHKVYRQHAHMYVCILHVCYVCIPYVYYVCLLCVYYVYTTCSTIYVLHAYCIYAVYIH